MGPRVGIVKFVNTLNNPVRASVLHPRDFMFTKMGYIFSVNDKTITVLPIASNTTADMHKIKTISRIHVSNYFN